MQQCCSLKNSTATILYYRIIRIDFDMSQSIKYFPFYACHTIRYCNVCNTATTRKCSGTYARYAIRYCNIRDVAATVKCLIAYSCHAPVIWYYAFSASGYQSSIFINNAISCRFIVWISCGNNYFLKQFAGIKCTHVCIYFYICYAIWYYNACDTATPE